MCGGGRGPFASLLTLNTKRKEQLWNYSPKNLERHLRQILALATGSSGGWQGCGHQLPLGSRRPLCPREGGTPDQRLFLPLLWSESASPAVRPPCGWKRSLGRPGLAETRVVESLALRIIRSRSWEWAKLFLFCFVKDNTPWAFLTFQFCQGSLARLPLVALGRIATVGDATVGVCGVACLVRKGLWALVSCLMSKSLIHQLI